MSEHVVASGARSLRRGDLVSMLAMAVIAVGGNLLPRRIYPPASVIQQALRLDAVPQLAQSITAALLAIGALLLFWYGPRTLWPLCGLALVLTPLRGTGIELFVVSYCAGLTYRKAVPLAGYLAAACLVVLLPAVLAGTQGGLLEHFGAGAGLFVLVPLLLGQWVGSRRQILANLSEHATQQEREQRIKAEAARAEERAKIARDMHDVVAHRVSLMVLYAGALEAQAGNEKQAEYAELIRATGREALTQLRQVLGVLRGPEDDTAAPQPRLSDVDELVARSRSAGIPLERVDEGAATELPAVVQHTAYRVVQEALTNVHKHAGAVPTELRLRHLPDGLEVSVCNAAPQQREPLPGTGSGLIGLRERVQVLGGTFTAQPGMDGGFRVTAWLPAT